MPPSPVSIEIVGSDGRTFREIPVNARDGALRSWLQAEKGARYEVRVRNTTGERLGLVIAVDGRNIINGKRSELSRTEPMYVLDAWDTQDYAGWRASLDAINEFYFTDWNELLRRGLWRPFRARRDRRGGVSAKCHRRRPAYQPYRERRAEADAAADASRSAAIRSALDASAGKSEGRAATNPPAPDTAIGAPITPCRSNSRRMPTPKAATSSSTNGAKRCAASI